MTNQLAKLIVFSAFLALSLLSTAQHAPWIAYPSANNTVYGVYHFRHSFDLDQVPEKLLIHVSADNRYNLFVNGTRVCYGPAKGDLKTYKYDLIDIVPFLKKGKNQLAALVYNGGDDKPMAFVSVQSAFMLETEDDRFAALNTGNHWKVFKNPAYQVISYNEMIYKNPWVYGFYACGGGDELEAKKYPWAWEKPDFDDSAWLNAEALFFEKKAPWNLVPRTIPFMDNQVEYPVSIRKAIGLDMPARNWDGQSKLLIPANVKASVLIDFDNFTMGYPELTVNKGREATIQINYAEALYEAVNLKAHRDSVNGLTMFGVWDIFYPDGELRTFRPLWKRAFRYVQLTIETKETALEIVSFNNEYSGYPYTGMATFVSNNDSLNKVFEICKRTLQMCSAETYYDTPFYEQLSYGGDNRPISAISTYHSTDDRLLREVLRLYPQSVNSETGLFKSAYPSRFGFDMGTWSLAWVQTLRDYYFMRGDSAFISQFTGSINRVLEFYHQHLDEKSGLIGTVSNQTFVDWSITKGSIPRSDNKNELKQSAILTLYYAHTLDCTAELYHELALKDQAEYWQRISNETKAGIVTSCWNPDKQLFRDFPDREIYSQHTNILAILCDLVPPVQQQELLKRILAYRAFDEMASSYFSFFLFKAMQKTGQEDLLLEHLGFWFNFLQRGFTTCGETGFASLDRSDCHAWSAHPAYFFLSSVCGIKPADVGFRTVKITPHLGTLQFLNVSMPHPKGRIGVKYSVKRNGTEAQINLPKGMSGTFELNDKKTDLKEGINTFIF
ncbi:MAG: alpha-L-rhamnosidase C-terminal domain-containing protein [Mangrovibacterium sp.]